MSHIAETEVKPGEPLIRDLKALRMSSENLNLEYVDGLTHYRTWKDDHNGTLVGDWKVPSGWNEQELGDNAVAVIRVPEAKARELEARYGNRPYEIGVVPDKANPGCFKTQHDFYRGGCGIEEIVGPTRTSRGKVESMCPTLLEHYAMCCDKLVAQEEGDEIEFYQDEQGAWYSKTTTEARLGV